MFARFSVLLVTLLTMGIAWAPSAAAYEPQPDGLFNVPRPWGSGDRMWRLMLHVERAMDNTPAGEKILISTYLLDRDRSVDRLIAACKRGVSVRVILDEDIANKNSVRLIKSLNGDNPPDEDGDGAPDGPPATGNCGEGDPLVSGQVEADPLTDAEAIESVSEPGEEPVTWGTDRSYAKKCDGSCRGAGGNMHSKFYAFSQTGTANDVVMVSSANLNLGGAAHGWNDLFTIKNRPVTFAKFDEIHREMTDDSRAGDGKVELVDGPYTSRFFPMKDASKANDPTLGDLNKIGCSSAFGRTRVNISMFYWKGTRGNYIADKLLNLARAGCRVSIIYGAPSLEIAERLRAAAGRNLIDLFDSRWDFNDDGYNEVRTHAKYVLVKGRFGANASSYQVMTGSQNWVAGSLSRGDEVSLNIAGAPAWNDYIQNWNDIREHSRRLPYNR
ncbi:MAG: phospholipase D-like domain-containing protein [Actinomycetota bacterium]|nr:phospholipase D-like domain-containing protein [Actinomycetota bacterium]